MPRAPSSHASVLQQLIFGPLEARIATARPLVARLEEAHRAGGRLHAGTSALAARLTELEAVMAELALGPRCAICAAGRAGGCCSALMAEQVDGPLLLMNALLGHGIPELRQDPWECGFLGPAGCTLRLKPLFCLSYLCRPLREALTAPERLRLEQATEALQWQQTALEEALHGWLRATGALVGGAPSR